MIQTLFTPETGDNEETCSRRHTKALRKAAFQSCGKTPLDYLDRRCWEFEETWRNLKKLSFPGLCARRSFSRRRLVKRCKGVKSCYILLWCFVISSNILSWTVLWFKSYDVLWMCYGSLSEKHKPCRAIMPLHTQRVMTRPTWQNHAKSRFGFWQDDGREATLGLLGSFWHGPSASMTRAA